MQIKEEPKIDWTNLVGILLIFVGIIFFLTGFHYLNLNIFGFEYEIFKTVFKILTIEKSCVIRQSIPAMEPWSPGSGYSRRRR